MPREERYGILLDAGMNGGKCTIISDRVITPARLGIGPLASGRKLSWAGYLQLNLAEI